MTKQKTKFFLWRTRAHKNKVFYVGFAFKGQDRLLYTFRFRACISFDILLVLGGLELGVESITTLNAGNVVVVPPDVAAGGSEGACNDEILDELLAEFANDGSNHFQR